MSPANTRVVMAHVHLHNTRSPDPEFPLHMSLRWGATLQRTVQFLAHTRPLYAPLIIFAMVAFGNDKSSSVDPEPPCPSLSDILLVVGQILKSDAFANHHDSSMRSLQTSARTLISMPRSTQ